MYRLLTLLLLALIVALQYKLWQGEGSWTAEQALLRQVEEQRSENVRLKMRNEALQAEVEDLKNGQAAVEERARSELGMVKPGETFYRVVEPADPKMNMRPEDVPEDAGSPAADSPASDVQSASGLASSSKSQDVPASGKAASPAAPDKAAPDKAAPDKTAPAAQKASGKQASPAAPAAKASKK